MWDELFPAERERVVRLLVKEAVLTDGGLDIGVRTNGLRSLATELADGAEAEAVENGATVAVHVPMTFKVRGGRKEILLPPDAHTAPDLGPPRPIVVALARAHRWQEMLDTGQVDSMDELAGRYGVDTSYVSRMLKLTSLAPDILEAILHGEEPDGLSLRRLQKTIPVCWREQQRRWGRKP